MRSRRKPNAFASLSGPRNADSAGYPAPCGGVSANPFPNLSRGRFRRFQIAAPLCHAFEEFVAFTQSPHANVLVLEHRFDDAKNGFRPEVIAMIEALHAFKDFVFAQAGVLERALLETIAFDEVGLVLLDEPA